jgi:DNA repair protein RecN (Recombination protein N)
LQVSKSSSDSTVETRLRRLDSEDKVQEIARMLGGVTITPQTLAHAREMLES